MPSRLMKASSIAILNVADHDEDDETTDVVNEVSSEAAQRTFVHNVLSGEVDRVRAALEEQPSICNSFCYQPLCATSSWQISVATLTR